MLPVEAVKRLIELSPKCLVPHFVNMMLFLTQKPSIQLPIITCLHIRRAYGPALSCLLISITQPDLRSRIRIMYCRPLRLA